MNKKFIINLKGRDYPLYAGILDEAHNHGLVSIQTHLLKTPSEESPVAIVKAQARFKRPNDEKDYIFEGIGDASPANVTSTIATALIRMAETRAKGRALRDAINVGMTMYEELPVNAAKTPEKAAEGSSEHPSTQAQWKAESERDPFDMPKDEKPVAPKCKTKGCEEEGIYRSGEVKQGTNKGRTYEGWFCKEKDHKPIIFNWLDNEPEKTPF